jgi:hypothetical protein
LISRCNQAIIRRPVANYVDKEAFDNADIMVLAIRTLDFGIKGGEKLSEMKLNLINAQNNEPNSQF